MNDINNKSILEGVEIKDLTPQSEEILTANLKPYQDKIEEKPVEKVFNPVVYVSMQHEYPPIKVLDMTTDIYEGAEVFVPTEFLHDYKDSRYRGTSLLSFNYLIDNLTTLYFKMSGDLFSLLGPDNADETAMRIYGVQGSRKTFLVLLREALAEYANIDGKTLYTSLEWLEDLGIESDTTRSSLNCLRKYRFKPNWIEWMRGNPAITEDRVILPFRIVKQAESYMGFNNSTRFAQNASSQTFYTYLTGISVCSYICDYPFIYSMDANGNFVDASAIFELKDPKFFELIFARVIAYYVKRNLDLIQLPGNVVSFNFDNLIQELNDKIQGYSEIAIAESVANFWNPYNATKF